METPEVTLFDYFRILKKRKRTIIWLFIAAVFFSGLLSKFVIPPTFEATTTLIFPQPEPTAPTVFLPTTEGGLSKAASLVGLGGNQEPTDPYLAILKSRTIAERAVYKFNLQDGYKTDTLEQTIKRLQDNVKPEVTKEGLIQLTVDFRGTCPFLSWFKKQSPASPADDARQMAADIANFYIDALSEFTQREVFLHTATKYRSYVEEQLEKSREELRKAEEALRSYKEQKGVVSLPDEVKGALDNIAKLEADKVVTDAHLKEVEARVNLITKQIVEETKAPLQNVPAHSPFVQELRNKLVSQESGLALATKEFGPSHPKVIKLEMELEESKKQLNDELSRVLSSVKSKLAPELIDWEQERIATSARSAAEANVLSQLKARGGAVPAKETELTRRARDVEVLSGVYTLLADESEKARMAEAKEVITYQVLDRALPPDRKSRPRTGLNMALAGFLGLFVGIFWVFLGDYLARERGGEEAEANSAAAPQ